MTSAAELHPGWLRVRFSKESHADYHYRWLRHQCDQDRHPATGERTVCSSELPDDLAASEAKVAGDALVVTWAHDGRKSRFSLEFLREHAYARDREAAPLPPSDVASLEIDAGSTIGDGEILDVIRRTRGAGAAVLRRSSAPSHPEAETEPLIESFARAGLSIVGTHFGRIEDLRVDNTTNENTDQLGYTDAPVDLHTDQPFLEQPPRFQLLQSIRAASSGGESYVADALAAARYLESVDREAFHLLSTVPVRFHRKQKAFERVVVSPILSFEGDSFRVRASYFTMAPHRLPFDEMEAFYRAHDRFMRIVRNQACHYRFLLNPGELLFYDNHRMLHARTAFRGARWVRGMYFDEAG